MKFVIAGTGVSGGMDAIFPKKRQSDAAFTHHALPARSNPWRDSV